MATMTSIPLLKYLIGSSNERLLRKLKQHVNKINGLESHLKSLNDEALKDKTCLFRERLQQGESLDRLLPEAFAVVREASVRTLGLRHFDVQLIGGIALHQGKIAEMFTGEGKTLASTLTIYLNALAGKGVHVVTVNDYLAKRDAEWMGPIYHFLGLTVGVILPNQSYTDKQAAYQADITYGTNNEFGFDYLRDNMAFSLDQKVQRPLYYAIIDEVDSILIDEARTPLIISGPIGDDASLYAKVNALIPSLKQAADEDDSSDQPSASEQDGHYTLDEKTKQAFLTEEGHQFIEKGLIKAGLLSEGESLYDVKNINLMHHVNAGIRAHFLFKRDIDYIVHNNQIIIVDEHTGRTMEGRRWSDGLHQAVEAKEGVTIQNENQTLASITFQNYFRLYEKLAGMTGTADTEAFEFRDIYNLDVVVVPTNKPLIREDRADQIYLTQKSKYKAVIELIETAHQKGQPILVGTASVETSEVVSALLEQANIPHQVLNAKNHAKEAGIIAQAGKPGSVIIATNVVGRGINIVLGGNPKTELAALENPTEDQINAIKQKQAERQAEVIRLGGLLVIGTERNESRRIDNQLRGRAGRQGDPGESVFYLSLEDNLMRIFASERVAALMQRLGLTENELISHSLVSRAIENAQRKLEAHNFSIRKELLTYDNVANDQRKVIYAQRDALMASDNISDTIRELREEVITDLTEQHMPINSFEEQWDITTFKHHLEGDFGLSAPIEQWVKEDQTGELNTQTMTEKLLADLEKAYQAKEDKFSADVLRQIEKSIMLESLDQHWKEHIAAMDHLRQGIHLRSYAQKDPKQEFKRESFTLFSEFLQNMHYDVISLLSRVELADSNDINKIEAQHQAAASDNAELQYNHSTIDNLMAQATAASNNANAPTDLHGEKTNIRQGKKVGRNNPCHCGSGKKFKHCHGR